MEMETQNNGYTRKQMGDACETLVAAELTLVGVPALKMPDNWPGYDVIAQLAATATPQRISVKSRTFKTGPAYLDYKEGDSFDWLAIVILPGNGETRRRLFLIPRTLTDKVARRDRSPNTCHLRYWRVDEVAKVFSAFEDNFQLKPEGKTAAAA
jgi:hypothetical protein